MPRGRTPIAELGNAPIEKLIAERNRIDQLISDRIEAEKQVLLAKLTAIERFESKRRVKPVQPDLRSTKSRAKAAPKYRNSKTGETWSGRGLFPRWLRQAMEAGNKREDFLIPASVSPPHSTCQSGDDARESKTLKETPVQAPAPLTTY